MTLQNNIIFILTSLSTIQAYPQEFHAIMTSQEFESIFGIANDKYSLEYEVVPIQQSQMRRMQHSDDILGMTFGAFGNQFQLSLLPNNLIRGPNLKVVTKDINGERFIASDNNVSVKHYIGGNGTTMAAMSTWNNDKRTEGVIITPAQTLEIRSIPEALHKLLKPNSGEILYLIKRSAPYIDIVDNGDTRLLNNSRDEKLVRESRIKGFRAQNLKRRNSIVKEKTIELGIFFDEEAYKKFGPFFKNDDEIREVLLGFVNQLQAIFYQESLGEKIHLTVTYIEIMKAQPISLPHYNGNRYQLLTSFCKYQKQLNPDNEGNEKHWDMALYLTGLDLFAMENGKRNSITMGLTAISGICIPDHSCVVAEFGATSKDGRPFPTAGWASTYIAAHEMGHNLGMLHDGYGNNCPKDGFIMSASRGFRAETIWSQCSAETIQQLRVTCLNDRPVAVPQKLDHSVFKLLPGQKWTAHDQCKLYLRDSQAVIDADSLTTICSSLKCKSRNRLGYYLAGPALDGTFCGNNKWCKSGSCVNWSGPQPRILEGGWGPWTPSNCASGCIINSKGAITRIRECDSPKPENFEYCQGPNVEVDLCDDTQLCIARLNVTEYASEKCQQFSQIVTDITGKGTQVNYNAEKPWQSCAIFCRSVYGTWYTPRYDLNDLPIDTYFPDGTWCHNDGHHDYFCQQRTCASTASPNLGHYMTEKFEDNSELDFLIRQMFTYADKANEDYVVLS